MTLHCIEQYICFFEVIGLQVDERGKSGDAPSSLQILPTKMTPEISAKLLAETLHAPTPTTRNWVGLFIDERAVNAAEGSPQTLRPMHASKSTMQLRKSVQSLQGHESRMHAFHNPEETRATEG